MTTPSMAGSPALPDDLAARVHAFVDGELPADEARAFEQRMARDPALVRAVDEARALASMLRGAYDEVLDEPVPASLRAVLEPSVAGEARDAGDESGAANDAAAPRSSDPVSPADARAARRAPAWRLPEWIGLAAALLLGVQAGRLATTGTPGEAAARPAYAVASTGELRAAAPLAAALESAPGGSTSGTTTLGLSFRLADGTACRSYAAGGAEVRTQGIACKRGDGWDVAWVSRTATPTTPAPAETASHDAGYRTAASTQDPALLARIDAMREGDTLDASQEAAARASGWAARAR